MGGGLIVVFTVAGVLGFCCVPLAIKGVRRLSAIREDRSDGVARRERERRDRVRQHLHTVSQGFARADTENPMVGGGGGHEQEPPPAADGPWHCSLCMFGNGTHARVCVMCGAARGAWRMRWGVWRRSVPS